MAQRKRTEERVVFTVDDDPRTGWILRKILACDEWKLEHFEIPGAVLDRLREGARPDLIMADVQMPVMDGIELTRRIRADFPSIPVLIMTAFGTIETAVKAMKAGAIEFVTKPINAREIREITRQVMRDRSRGTAGGTGRGAEGEDGIEMIGESPAFVAALAMMRRVADTDITVLLRGESGTGKELFARALHALSSRRTAPLVTIDCATLPDPLMESELFGHEKGAFTDARANKIGKFELAHTGTILLDEIGNLTPSSQMKILRVIQERTIERLGGTQQRQIDFRLIAATNADLDDAIRRGTFREDLYYRLNEITIRIPSLRDRPEDIPLLVAHFASRFAAQFDRTVPAITPEVLQLFSRYHWPGNVRELRNVIKRAVILADNEIRERDLPEEMMRSMQRDATHSIPSRLIRSGEDDVPDLKEVAREEMHRIERDIILRTLEQTRWHLSKTAELLGVDRKTLRHKMRSFQILRPE